MSALLNICEYGSDSEENDCAGGLSPVQKKPRLHVPDLSRVAFVTPEVHIDKPDIHCGRQRSFPHVRGNWPSFVYIKYPEEQNLNTLIEKLQSELYPIDEHWQKSEDIHLSLSKTFILKFHLIKSFTSSLQEALSGTECFELDLNTIKVYCNEEKSRTFLALEVDYFSHKYLKNILKKIDGVLTDYTLPTFYDEPSFHLSLLWTNGNKKEKVSNILEKLNSILQEELHQNNKSIVIIRKINCKIGNKYFQYSLQ